MGKAAAVVGIVLLVALVAGVAIVGAQLAKPQEEPTSTRVQYTGGAAVAACGCRGETTIISAPPGS